MDIEVVSTGSHGNMNVIDGSIVIDFGVKRDILKNILPSIDALLVSHQHGDHISLPCLRMIRRERPALLGCVYMNKSTHDMVSKADPVIGERITHIIDGSMAFRLPTRKQQYTVQTFPLAHDVENQGFIITDSSGETLIHATDTSTMAHCPDAKFDNILVEGNWDEDKLFESLASEDTTVAFRASRNLRHLSVQALAEFISTHAKPTSKVYQLHLSSAFGIDAREVTTDTLKNMLQPLHDQQLGGINS